MAATPDDLFAFLAGLGIKTETQQHPAVFTVEESKALRGVIPGAHVKNLFIKDKKSNLFLISAVENTKIDLKTIHETIGGQGRVTFCSADTLRDYLGVEPGSVTPLAVFNDKDHKVKVVLDARLMDYDRINVHPLVNTMTTGLAKADLLAFLQATGHEPLIAKIGEPADEA